MSKFLLVVSPFNPLFPALRQGDWVLIDAPTGSARKETKEYLDHFGLEAYGKDHPGLLFNLKDDIDDNGSADLVYIDGLESRVRYLNNDLTLVSPRHRWIVQGRSGWRDLYADAQTDLAAMDGSGQGQMFCSYNGNWQALPPNANKGATLFGERVNTWEVWPNHYLPINPATGEYGYYDSGDPAVNDAQIRQMHDFGFNYVMFDITNGHHSWVDDRAKAFISRIRLWNESLQPGQHKMHFCIALGRTRGVTGGETAFFTKLEEECQRAWDEFYVDNLDLVYELDGEPLLIHMLDGNAEPFWGGLATWSGPRANIDRMTNRSFRNWQRTTDNAPYGCSLHFRSPPAASPTPSSR